MGNGVWSEVTVGKSCVGVDLVMRHESREKCFTNQFILLVNKQSVVMRVYCTSLIT